MIYLAPVALAKAANPTAAPSTADAVKKVTDSVNILYKIVAAGVSGLGGIAIVLGLMDVGNAYSQQQSSEMSHALKKVVGGVIICAAGTIAAILM